MSRLDDLRGMTLAPMSNPAAVALGYMRGETMSQDISRCLADPKPGMTLDELARELNELGKIKENARLAFCKRLAVVYLMVVGHRPANSHDGGKFYDWCARKIRAGNGKEYSRRTLKVYVAIGFSKSPEKTLREHGEASKKSVTHTYSLGTAIKKAVSTESPPKVIPITKLKQQGMSADVATEVNRLMTAWEQASSQARSQFMYLVTGKRIAA